MMRNSITKCLWILFVTVSSIVFMVMNIDIQALQESITKVNTKWLYPSLFLFLLNVILRGSRFYILQNKSVSIVKCVDLASISVISNYLLPMRLGEVVTVYLLKKNVLKRTTESIAATFSIRIIDLSCLSIVSLLYILFGDISPLTELYKQIDYSEYFTLGWLSFFTVSVILLFVISFFYVKKIKYFLIRLLKDSSAVFKNHKIWAVSFLIMINLIAQMYYILISIPIYCGIGLSFIIIFMGAFMAFIPLQGLANLGNHQIVWVLVLSSINISYKDAIGYSIISHFILLSFLIVLIVLSAISWITYNYILSKR